MNANATVYISRDWCVKYRTGSKSSRCSIGNLAWSVVWPVYAATPIMSNGMYVRKTVAREQERSKIKKKVKRGRMHKAKKSFNYPSNFAETAPRPWRELTAFVQKFILLFLPLGFCVLAVLMGISGSWLILWRFGPFCSTTNKRNLLSFLFLMLATMLLFPVSGQCRFRDNRNGTLYYDPSPIPLDLNSNI